MPKPLNTKLSICKLRTLDERLLLTPIGHHDIWRFNLSEHVLANEMAEAWKKYWLLKGRILPVLRQIRQGDWQNEYITIDITPPRKRKKNVTHSPTTATNDETTNITLPYCFTTLEDGRFLGILPILQIEALAESHGELIPLLQHYAKLALTRKDRFEKPSRMVEILWFTEQQIENVELNLEIYSSHEIASANQPQDALIPQISTLYTAENPELFGLSQEFSRMLLSLGHYQHDSTFELFNQQNQNNQPEQTSTQKTNKLRQSVLIVGKAGSGKTALVDSYTYYCKISKLNTPRSTTASQLIQGLTIDEGWQSALGKLCKEFANTQDVLYVNHLNELFEVGQYVGNNMSLGQALRDPLLRGEITLIAEATHEELAWLQLNNPSFVELFTQIHLPELTSNEQEKLLAHCTRVLLKRYACQIEKQALALLYDLQIRFSPYSGFPGVILRRLENLLMHQEEIHTKTITTKQVLHAFHQETGLPLMMIDPMVPFDQKQVATFFKQRVFGQDHAIEHILNVLTTLKANISRREKPLANLLFVGPTGVGKTELAKTLAEFLFGDSQKMIRLDMSEYADSNAALRLLEDRNNVQSLVSLVHRAPFCVVLLDEIEKAHPDCFDPLLQLLGEGRLTSNQGQLTNFCSTIVLMTSNLGAENANKNQIGFHHKNQDQHQHAYTEVLQKTFRPELFNRIDQIIVFEPLTQAIYPKIIQRELTAVKQRTGFINRGVELNIDANTQAQLLKSPHYQKYGARAIKRSIEQEIVRPLSTILSETAIDTKLFIESSTTAKSLDSPTNIITFNIQQLTQQKNNHSWLTQTDLMSDKRRGIQAMMSGPVATRLYSEQDRLEHEIKRLHAKIIQLQNETKYAQKNKQSALHQAPASQSLEEKLLQTIEQHTKVNELLTQLEQILKQAIHEETQLLQQGILNITDSTPEINVIASDLNHLQNMLYAKLFPEQQHCQIGLYGSEDQILIWSELLTQICVQQNFQVNWFTILLRHATDPIEYIETTKPNDQKAQSKNKKIYNHLASVEIENKPKENEYIRFAYPLPNRELAKKRKMIGLEARITGLNAGLFFAPEIGIIKIELENNRSQKLYRHIQIGSSNMLTPEKVHRQTFFDDKPSDLSFSPEKNLITRRQSSTGLLNTKRPAISLAFPDAAAWLHYLRDTYQKNLKNILLGKEQ